MITKNKDVRTKLEIVFVVGKCVPCSGDTFKKEDDKYGQCINKTV